VERVRLLQLREELRAELAEHDETGRLLRSGLAAVDKLLERSNPPESTDVEKQQPRSEPQRRSRPAAVTESDTPRGSQAVEIILRETGTWMDVRDLTMRQLERGWTPHGNDPKSAVRAAANRLARDKPENFERDRGRYRFRDQSAQQPSLNGDGPTQGREGVDDPSMTAVSAFTGDDRQSDEQATTA
jgi:hypothetical protein